MSFGLVRTWNQSKEPVELVEARLLHLDPDLELLGFTAREYREAPGSAREFPVPLSVPLDEFPVLPPADEEQFVILFGLRLRSGGVAGSALGVEVTYRQGGELRKQTFRAAAYICKADSVVSDCIDDDPMRTQEYDDLLSESARRGTGVGPAPT